MAQWNIEDVWNDALIVGRAERENKPRDYIYASEIGKNFWDRYQKMMGVEPTNPYDARLLRKFAAGNLFEDLVGMMLKKCGILIAEQERVELPETHETLRVSGRIDFHAGGIVDWDEAVTRVDKEDMPEAIKNVCYKIIERFRAEYPAGLDDCIIEVKSVNSMLFWAKKDYLQEAYPWHIYQTLTYMKVKGKPGKVMYISKDDLTVKECDIVVTPEMEEEFKLDLVMMTKYYRDKEEPPKPPIVIFDPRKKYTFSAKKELEKIGTAPEILKLMTPYFDDLVSVSAAYKVEFKGQHEVNWEYERSQYRNLLTDTTSDDEFDDWYSEQQTVARDKDKLRKEAFMDKIKSLTPPK